MMDFSFSYNSFLNTYLNLSNDAKRESVSSGIVREQAKCSRANS